MQRTTTRTEPLMPLQATANELVAVGAAITAYTRLLTYTPQSAAEHAETIKLLDSFQKRLTDLPPGLPAPQEASYEQRA
jgi:hypothetical protein